MTKEEIRQIVAQQAQCSVHAEREQIPVRGNAMASGNDRTDRALEDAILARLDRDDIWAWAAVTVTANWQGIEGSAHLGCCCYLDEHDFRECSGYFDDLASEALEEIVERVHHIVQALA